MLGSRPFTGRLFDRVGPHIVIYPSIALFAIGLWMLTATQTATMLLYPALSSALATALWCHVYKHLRYSTHQQTVQATPQQLSLPCMIRDCRWILCLRTVCQLHRFSNVYLIAGVVVLLSMGVFIERTKTARSKSTKGFPLRIGYCFKLH